ncbi:MAG TPA: 30S ribosomal protein S14 [Candidatus Nanoarchaeia archaeon]|nr:30S ribosomal protein S14 [Candidatus Nanoarchaeia archaeon]
MTAKDYKKAFKQLEAKPAKLKKYLKHNAPKKRTTGIGQRSCHTCGRHGAHIRSYGIHLCRQCFREQAKILGFKQYN